MKMTRDFKSVASASIALAMCFGLVACKKDNDAPEKTPEKRGADTTISVKKSQLPALENPHCLYGCPVGAPDDNRVVQRSIYVLSNNKTTKFADWVAYTVKKENIGKIETRNFKADPDLPANETLKLTDYINARDPGFDYDIGHQAPLTSFAGHTDWAMSNYLGNTTPQKAELNEGPWLQIENFERKIASCTNKTKKKNRNLSECATQDHVDVHVQTGTLYEREMPKLPHARLEHTVPSGYWKILSVERNGQLWTAAFIMDQDMHRSDRLCEGATTIEAIEKRKNYTFFPLYQKDTGFKSKPGALLPYLGCKP